MVKLITILKIQEVLTKIFYKIPIFLYFDVLLISQDILGDYIQKSEFQNTLLHITSTINNYKLDKSYDYNLFLFHIALYIFYIFKLICLLPILVQQVHLHFYIQLFHGIYFYIKYKLQSHILNILLFLNFFQF